MSDLFQNMSDIIFFCSRKIFEFPNRQRSAAYAPCRSCRHYVRKTTVHTCIIWESRIATVQCAVLQECVFIVFFSRMYCFDLLYSCMRVCMLLRHRNMQYVQMYKFFRYIL